MAVDDEVGIPGAVPEAPEETLAEPDHQRQEEEGHPNPQERHPHPQPPPSQTTPDSLHPVKPQPRDYLKRIPIVGLQNLLYADTMLEIRFWIIILIFAAVTTVAYLVPTIVNFAKFQLVLDVHQIAEPDLPFPPVYACTSNSINDTYVRNLVMKVQDKWIRDARLLRLIRNGDRDPAYFIDDVLAYATISPSAERWFDLGRISVFNEFLHKVVAAHGSEWPGYKNVYQQSAYACENVLHKCKYNGIEFPCCADGKYGQLTGTTICFRINVRSYLPFRACPIGNDPAFRSAQSILWRHPTSEVHRPYSSRRSLTENP